MLARWHSKPMKSLLSKCQASIWKPALALIHRLKSRMIPFKDAKNHIKNCSQKFMDIITLFIMPICYIAFKDFVWKFIGAPRLSHRLGHRLSMILSKVKTQACLIDFMFALSTMTNQKELLKSTQKGGAKAELQKDLSELQSSISASMGLYKSVNFHNNFIFRGKRWVVGFIEQ